jgi:hypothetical protein
MPTRSRLALAVLIALVVGLGVGMTIALVERGAAPAAPLSASAAPAAAGTAVVTRSFDVAALTAARREEAVAVPGWRVVVRHRGSDLRVDELAPLIEGMLPSSNGAAPRVSVADGQLTVTGTAQAIDRAAELLRGMGARVPMQVAWARLDQVPAGGPRWTAVPAAPVASGSTVRFYTASDSAGGEVIHDASATARATIPNGDLAVIEPAAGGAAFELSPVLSADGRYVTYTVRPSGADAVAGTVTVAAGSTVVAVLGHDVAYVIGSDLATLPTQRL